MNLRFTQVVLDQLSCAVCTQSAERLLGVPVTVAKVCQFVFLRMRLAVQIRVRRLPVLQRLERCTLPSAASYSLGALCMGEGCPVLCHFETW